LTNFGIFVQLPNTVEGLLRYDALLDDEYIYDEKNYLVKGKRGGKEFRLGQKIKVEVINASKEKRQIDFGFVGD
ncbi:MAG: S1 RNA-binding domain-containing protein, partial [Tissierellia bacterium]|nr:S1 RNA-binding domain-containing protein [Tissierellia bacterium]